MTNHHAILGVASNATEDEVKKAYRRLAMEHHPDRGGDEEKFKQIKAAFEAIEKNGFRAYTPPTPPRQSTFTQRPGAPTKGSYSPGDLDDILEKMRRSHAPNYSSHMQPESEPVAQVTLRQAYRGFTMPVQIPRGNLIEHQTVDVLPGYPNGYRGPFRMSNGQSKTIHIRIETPGFHVRGVNSHNNLFDAGLSVGDVEIQVELDAIDLITGCWTIVEDFLGEQLQVRIPAGFSPLQRLKVANKGYYGWNEDTQKPASHRQHMFIKINPVFKAPQNIDRKKILALYNAVGGWENDVNENV